MEEKHIVCLSGGKDSTAMLLMMIEKGMKIDDIIFCDTSVEFPEMYEHLKKLENYIGRKITILKADKNFEYYLLHKIKTRGKYKGQVGYGFPNIRNRWCTGNLKRTPIEKFKKKYKGYKVIEYVGIAADEVKRLKDKKYPLAEWGITEKQALEYCYSKGFDWGGLYEYFDRLSCWCCPLSNLKELKILWKHFPKLWNKLKEWEGKSIGQFRTDYSVPELEKKFACEERGEKYKKEKSSVLSK